MKVDREKAHGTNGGNMYTSWSARELIDLVCDVLESQSHLWERGSYDVMRDFELHTAKTRIAELERENERLRSELSEANEACTAALARHTDKCDVELDRLRSALARERSDSAKLSDLNFGLKGKLSAERERAEKAEAEVAKLRSEMDAWKHNSRVHKLERKAAEDAALIKSLQEQFSEASEQRDLAAFDNGSLKRELSEARAKLAETQHELAGVKEHAERMSDTAKKFLAERDEALGKLEKLRAVLKVRPGESAFGYGVRVRDDSAEVLGGEP